MPVVRSREVTGAQRSGVRHCENTLKVFDFGDGSVNVHALKLGSDVDHSFWKCAPKQALLKIQLSAEKRWRGNDIRVTMNSHRRLRIRLR